MKKVKERAFVFSERVVIAIILKKSYWTDDRAETKSRKLRDLLTFNHSFTADQ